MFKGRRCIYYTKLFQYVVVDRLEATFPKDHKQEVGLGNGLLEVLFCGMCTA